MSSTLTPFNGPSLALAGLDRVLLYVCAVPYLETLQLDNAFVGLVNLEKNTLPGTIFGNTFELEMIRKYQKRPVNAHGWTLLR